MKCPRCDERSDLIAPGAIFVCPGLPWSRITDYFVIEHYYELARESMPNDRDPLLQEREKTHGSFEMNAEISQQLKDG